MKGNEARVVFFLHPVDQLKDGQVSQVKPLTSSFAVTFLLLLGLLLGLGVLLFVFLQFGVQARSRQEPVPFDTTTESPVTEKTEEPESAESERSTEVTINQSRANDSTTATELPIKIIQPGITYDTLPVTHPNETTLEQEYTPPKFGPNI